MGDDRAGLPQRRWGRGGGGMAWVVLVLLLELVLGPSAGLREFEYEYRPAG